MQGQVSSDRIFSTTLDTTPSVEAVALRRGARILVVDDEPLNCDILAAQLEDAGFGNVQTSSDSDDIVAAVRKHRSDVVLLDMMMPHVNGLDALLEIRSSPDLAQLPVLVITASTDRERRIIALRLGASDYLNKPVDIYDLLPRLDNALLRKEHADLLENYATRLRSEVRRKTIELEAAQLRIVYCLARAAEYRDNETGDHVVRVSRYAGIIARQLGMTDKESYLIELAAPLHDIGKIGVSDSILLKPGRLTEDEWKSMRKHCEIGRSILAPPPSDRLKVLYGSHEWLSEFDEIAEPQLLQVASEIAGSHHEKWDGSGYPQGLKGEQIPLSARITAVADVFDALGSERPYKQPFSLAKCLDIMREGRGVHFDPDVLDAFFDRLQDIVEVRREYACQAAKLADQSDDGEIQ